MTQGEEDPIEYRARVVAYLQKTRTRRLPWGTVVAGGALTFLESNYRARYERVEMGEAAITLLEGLGVSLKQIAALADMPFDTSPAALVARLLELQNAPPEPEPAPQAEKEPEPAHAPREATSGRQHEFGGPACVCGLMPGAPGPRWCPGPRPLVFP